MGPELQSNRRRLGMRLVLADRFCGHGMPCPYWGKGNGENEERGRGCAKHLAVIACVSWGAG